MTDQQLPDGRPGEWVQIDGGWSLQPKAARRELFIDIETYSATDLKTAGVYRYVEDPTFEITLLAYAFDDEPVMPVDDIAQWIKDTPELTDPAWVKVAHNAAFERICFSRALGMPTGEYLPPEQWHDTQAIASEKALPQKLEQLARVLGGEQKDPAGTRLINLFAKPNKEGRRVMPHERPVQWAEFVRYCGQDVVTLRSVHRALGGWPTAEERQIYYTDQRINDRGMRLDRTMAGKAYAATLKNKITHEKEFRAVTGVENPNSNPQVSAWVRQQGLGRLLPDLQAETVERALREDLTPDQRRALELRQELALVASRKYAAALAMVCQDDRLRGQFFFHGAHTGRWSGRGVQLHNLPRHGFKDVVDQELAIEDLLTGELLSPDELKRLIRPLFLLDGCVVDYSSIEARVIAWVAGEKWALEAFRAGRDIYVETARQMGGLTRAQGKVAVLALGFGGSAGSLKAMATERDEYRGKPLAQVDDQVLKEALVYPWRRTNRKIVQLWANLQQAFLDGGNVGPLTVEVHGKDRAIRLPSGRRIHYHDIRTGSQVDRVTGKVSEITFKDYTRGGSRTKTYGGRLSENITQAIARDILGAALVRLEDAGFRPVAHVHDEALVERTDELEAIRRVMTVVPSWAAGLPINAEGFTCQRYRKG